MRNQLWLWGIYVRRNPALTVIGIAGLFTIVVLSATAKLHDGETLRWILFWGLMTGKIITALPQTLAKHQFGRLLPDIGSETSRWFLVATPISVGVFLLLYLLTSVHTLPWWAALALLVGCHLVASNRLLYFLVMVAILGGLSSTAAQAVLAAHPTTATLIGIIMAAAGWRYCFPFGREWQASEAEAGEAAFGSVTRLAELLKLVVPGVGLPWKSSPRAADGIDFESFGHTPVPGLRNPRMFAAIGVIMLLLALFARHLHDAQGAIILILNALGFSGLITSLMCALALRPSRLQMVMPRRQLWRAMWFATQRTAVFTGLVAALIGVIAAAVAGILDPHLWLRLGLTLLTIQVLFTTGSQWAYSRLPIRELADLARLQQMAGLRWATVWRELLMMLCSGAGAILVYLFPIAVVPVIAAAVAANSHVLRRHYLLADLA